MLSAFALYPILGKPLIMYGGLFSLLLLLLVAIIGTMVLKNKGNVSVHTHVLLARLFILLALLHAVLGLSIFFKF